MGGTARGLISSTLNKNYISRISGTQRYFHRGHITETYGSKYGGLVDAIQLGTPAELLIGEGRDTFGRAVAEAMVRFYNVHYANK